MAQAKQAGKGGGKGLGAGLFGTVVAAKIGLFKVVLALGSAGISLFVYAASYGLTFGIGLVALLFFHELGHWLAYRAFKIKPLAMVFIPFLGAAVLARRQYLPPVAGVVISLAGPVCGGVAAASCLLGAALFSEQSAFLVALARIGLILNLFNLIPLGFLDGGHALRAVLRARAEHQTLWLPLLGAGLGVVVLLGVGLSLDQGDLGQSLADNVNIYQAYKPLTANTFPDGIAVDTHGTVWFTEKLGNAVGHLNPHTGTVRDYHIPTPKSSPLRIAAGPDHAMWFTEAMGDRIGRIDAAGHITELPVQSGAYAWDLTTGPDGAIWFVEHDLSRIGRLDVQTRRITYLSLAADRNPSGLAVGPDRALWFVEDNGQHRGIGRITMTGQVSEYALPVTDSGPQMIANGNDGALYATLVKANALVRIVPHGAAAPTVRLIPLSPVPADVQVINNTGGGNSTHDSSRHPYALTAGLGGIWFNELGLNMLGRINGNSAAQHYAAFGPDSMSNTFPNYITHAADGTLWFTASEDDGSYSYIVHLSAVPQALGGVVGS